MTEILKSQQEETVYIDSQGEKYYILAAPDWVVEELNEAQEKDLAIRKTMIQLNKFLMLITLA